MAFSAGSSLTCREREVLAWVASGLPSEAIAARLGVRRSTVETHVASAVRKLGASSRRHAAVLARLAPSSPSTPQAAALTDVEAALLAALAEGRTLPAAARRLHTSARTASRRLASARDALGVSSTAEALMAWCCPEPQRQDA